MHESEVNFNQLHSFMMENQGSSSNKENADPASNVPAVEAPKIYTIESEFGSKSFQTFTFANLHKISVLRIIKELQQQHGLRHGDFQRYRGYCTRRVKRLRKALNLPQGDKRHFKKREVNITHLEGKKSSEKFVQIPLMLAERTWAYAMQVSTFTRWI